MLRRQFGFLLRFVITNKRQVDKNNQQLLYSDSWNTKAIVLMPVSVAILDLQFPPPPNKSKSKTWWPSSIPYFCTQWVWIDDRAWGDNFSWGPHLNFHTKHRSITYIFRWGSRFREVKWPNNDNRYGDTKSSIQINSSANIRWGECYYHHFIDNIISERGSIVSRSTQY